MQAKDIITHVLPVLKPEDKGQQALNLMEQFKVSHLAVVSGKKYLGLMSDKIIYDLNLAGEKLSKQQTNLPTVHVHENLHLLEVASLMNKLNLSVIPVVTDEHIYQGVITFTELSRHLINSLSIDETGGVVVLHIPEHSFSVSRIGQIIEGNDMQLLSLLTSKPAGSEMMEVTLKLNKIDLSALLQTFERYDIKVASAFMDDSILSDMYEDRLEQFLRYMNI